MNVKKELQLFSNEFNKEINKIDRYIYIMIYYLNTFNMLLSFPKTRISNNL